VEKVLWRTASMTSSSGMASPQRMDFQLAVLEAWWEFLAWQPAARMACLKETQVVREIGEATRRW
jgi:hypothetical protein